MGGVYRMQTFLDFYLFLDLQGPLLAEINNTTHGNCCYMAAINVKMIDTKDY